jgi:hypothetical protein
MYEPVGTVDHYLSIEGGSRHLAFQWRNFRYAASWVNSSKGTLDDHVFDPFEVGDGWFELSLPSLQLVVTDKVPTALRKKAQFTLDRLGLGHGIEGALALPRGAPAPEPALCGAGEGPPGP